MPEHAGKPTQTQPTPEPICTFTASLSCYQCRLGLLASWRADDKLAGSVKRVFHRFRAVHIGHPGYHEGIPSIGMHAPSDVPMPPGGTVLTHARCRPDPDTPGNLQFYDAQAPTFHTT